MSKALLLLCLIVSAASVFGQEITEGSLFAVEKNGATLGACPLKKTTVKTEISGFLSRVRVVQEFENSFTEPIEAVYTFPLSQNGAVDEMTMKIGDRVVQRQDNETRRGPRTFTKRRKPKARPPACSIRNGRTSLRSRSPTSCPAKG